MKTQCRYMPRGAAALVLGILLPSIVEGRGPLSGDEASLERDCLDRLRRTSEVMYSAYARGNLDGFLDHFVLATIDVSPGRDALVGRGALLTQRAREAQRGLRVYGLKWAPQTFRVARDFVYQTGPYAVTFARPGIAGVVTEFRKGLTVWERLSDGSLMVRLQAYSRDKVPDDPLAFGDRDITKGAALHMRIGGEITPFARDYLFDEMQRIEETFYGFILAGQTARADRCYVEDAFFGGSEDRNRGDPRTTARTIVPQVREGLLLTGLKREILEIDGDEEMVYVVQLLDWAFTDPVTGLELTVPGKGVHVWRRQPDLTWQIQVDIHNTDVCPEHIGQRAPGGP